jgi:hypothetical protein
VAIWDRSTGRAALLYHATDDSGGERSTWVPRAEGARPFVTWGDNGTLVLLDLTAIA